MSTRTENTNVQLLKSKAKTFRYTVNGSTDSIVTQIRTISVNKSIAHLPTTATWRPTEP